MSAPDPHGLSAAFAWRDKLLTNGTGIIRLYAGLSDGTDGLFVDRFGDFIAATLYDPLLATQAASLASTLEGLFPGRSILVKARKNAAANEYAYLTDSTWRRDAVLAASESGLRYEIHTDPRHDFGLYPDTKAARTALAGVSGGRTILNLFSYTCAFAVAAANAGAEVVNIDPSREYLDWGGRNAVLNGLTFKRYVDTTQDYLARHLRRLESGRDRAYDICIIDPPAFLVGRGSERLARNMWTLWLNQLEKTRCKRFLFVLNDKSAENRMELQQLVHKTFNYKIELETVPQSPDVLGRQVADTRDSFYLPPAVFWAVRD